METKIIPHNKWKRKEKSELEKELVYNTVYLPVRFFKKEAYIRLDHYEEVRDKRENAVNELEEDKKNLIRANKKASEHVDELETEIWRLKLHIETKDEAYMKLLKDYEELKDNSKCEEETLTKAIWEIINKLAKN